MQGQRITIVVSGQIFETSKLSLEKYPNTLLGNPERRGVYFDPRRRVYFFDRHRIAFEGILQYYQTCGRLICPDNVPEEVFEDELAFFGISEQAEQKVEARKYIFEGTQNTTGSFNLKCKVWSTLQRPESSRVAQLISMWSLCLTLFSISFVLLTSTYIPNRWALHSLFPYELFCFSWFTIEYLLRLWSAPDKRAFFRSAIDDIDLLTVVAYFGAFTLSLTQANSTGVLRIFRVANVFRVFRLSRYSYGLRLLIYTIYSSRMDLQLLIGFLALFIFLSASLVYFAEDAGDHSLIDSIPNGIWWSIITCTTVGYGDLYPISTVGKIIGGITAIFGALMILLPVLKLVNSFTSAIMATKPKLSFMSSAESKNNTMFRQ